MNGTSLVFEESIGDAISRIRFAPHCNNLLISSWDSKLRFYDVESSKLRAEARTEAALLDCCFQNESVALTVGSDCSIRRHDLNSGIDDTIGHHDNMATCVEFSDETCQVVTAGWDKKIKCWDARSSKPLEYSKALAVEVGSMSLSGFILMVAIGSSVCMYDLRNFDSIYTKESCLDNLITCVRPSVKSEGFVVGSIDGRVAVKYFSPSSSNSDGYVFRCHPKAKNGRTYSASVNDIAFNPSIDGSFVTGDNEGYMIMWDAQSKKRLFEFPRYSNGVASLSYNHAGNLLAVASSYTYQEANEIEEPPQIFIHDINGWYNKSYAAGGSK